MFSLFWTLRAHAERRSEATALTSGGVSVSYGQLAENAARAASAMAAHGVSAGDRVAFLGPNSHAYAVTLYGASALRAISITVNWRLSVAELTAVFADAQPRLIVATAAYADATSRAAPPGSTVVITPDADNPVADWFGAHEPLAAAEAPEPRDVAVLTYTSGTTGRAKGVIVTNEILENQLRVPLPFHICPDSVLLVPMPVFHTAGACWVQFGHYCGAHVVLLSGPEPIAVRDALIGHRVTAALLLTPVLPPLLDILEPGTEALAELEAITYGAAPIEPEVLEQTLVRLPHVGLFQAYGLTETSGPVTYLDASAHRRGSVRLRSAGRAAYGVELRVVDIDSGDPVPHGVTGEIQVRSERNCAGYWRAPADSAALYADDGWLRTGDAGRLDDDGWLFITDRIKDMIITGGENVYAREVETVLAQHPLVAEVCVIGAPHQRWGETVVAAVVAHPGAPGLRAQLITFARERLAHYKCPTDVWIVDELPRNATGKVLRRLVKSSYRSALEALART